jgi:uncharacterized protein (DUF1697 family)
MTRQQTKSTWIMLLRGINVGGKKLLAMKDLVRTLETFHFANIKTYIQSGNIVFQSAEMRTVEMSEKVASRIEEKHGFRPQVILLGADEFREAMQRNPFPNAETEPKTLHLLFLDSAPTAPDIDMLGEIKSATEQYQLSGRVFYLHAPDGIGRSKLAQRVEKCLGVAATGRNWRTVSKLWKIAQTM